MRKYIIALEVELKNNVSPDTWIVGKLGSLTARNVKYHIEEVTKNEEVSTSKNDSGNRGVKSRVERSPLKSGKTSGNTES